MNILTIISSVDERAGGPQSVVRDRSIGLEKLGHSVTIVSLDMAGSNIVNHWPIKIIPLGVGGGKYKFSKNVAFTVLKN